MGRIVVGVDVPVVGAGAASSVLVVVGGSVDNTRALEASLRICLRVLLRRAGGFQWGFLKGLGREPVSSGSRMGLGIGAWGAMMAFK